MANTNRPGAEDLAAQVKLATLEWDDLSTRERRDRQRRISITFEALLQKRGTLPGQHVVDISQAEGRIGQWAIRKKDTPPPPLDEDD